MDEMKLSNLIHCKKRFAVFPFPAEMSLTKLSWAGIIKLFPARESLARNIPAGDGKTANLFLQCIGNVKVIQGKETS